VFVLSCRDFAANRSLVQGVLWIVYRSKEEMKNLDTVGVRYKRNGYKKVADGCIATRIVNKLDSLNWLV
jgi:hypothetical protein